MVNASPVVCAETMQVDMFDMTVVCPEAGELVVWGSGKNGTPTLLYSSIDQAS